ncbi:TlpA family protein disulfide reductase [Nonlabens xiamenensis]|uniref:TlpA family protein disulfide reductase n=1 Tax=Nonlabens xiamenensis TaxID=2341043 RepID=UPI000F6068AA|nr:TlpA disulfide reductase family protein [Nonlabens xiamenensis]
MNKMIFFICSLLMISCNEKLKEKAQAPERITLEQADTSSNDTIHLTDLNDDYSSLDQVLAQHKGKVIYLDIWASWCGPCKAMMPFSDRLQESYKGKDVVFLFISIDTKEKMWKNAAQQFDITENSFLAHNYPKARLFQDNNVNSIPRYMLFDQNGRLVDDNAPRPSNPGLTTTLDAFLSL